MGRNKKMFHGTNAIDEIAESGKIYPSSDEVTAGASGVYLTGNVNNARQWGDFVVHVEIPGNLKIHPDITENPTLELMRRANQYSNEKANNVPEAENWYTPEEKNNDPRDVSEILEGNGFGGHIDSMVNKNDYVIYNENNLKILGATSPEGTYHPYDRLSQQFKGLNNG